MIRHAGCLLRRPGKHVGLAAALTLTIWAPCTVAANAAEGTITGCRNGADASAPDRVPEPDPLEPVALSRGHDVVEVFLDLSFDLERKSISGKGANTVVPFTKGLEELRSHCVDLDLDEVEIDGSAASFSETDDELVIDAAGACQEGQEAQVVIRYS